MASQILRPDQFAHKSFDPLTADDDAIITWLDERAVIREEEDRQAYEAWMNEEEAISLRERETWERIGNHFEHEEA